MYERALSWYFNPQVHQVFQTFQEVVKILFSQLIFVWYKCLILIQTCSRTIVDLK